MLEGKSGANNVIPIHFVEIFQRKIENLELQVAGEVKGSAKTIVICSKLNCAVAKVVVVLNLQVVIPLHTKYHVPFFPRLERIGLSR